MNCLIYCVVLFFIVFNNWGCSNCEFEDRLDSVEDINESFVLSRSVNTIDYNKYVLLEKRIVMPRTGEFYYGEIVYEQNSFPLVIYWDSEIEDLNLYAYIDGSNSNGYGTTYSLVHVATYNSESNNSRMDLVIKCNYFIDRGVGAVLEKRHVSSHITFIPNTKALGYSILEEGGDLWRGDE